ncbi:MAG: hypothetical protein M0T84_02110 [Betaproteobacteria bacterium]|nr:hypothetical protein [Betaproteobacteria bacterium]
MKNGAPTGPERFRFHTGWGGTTEIFMSARPLLRSGWEACFDRVSLNVRQSVPSVEVAGGDGSPRPLPVF